MLYRTLLLFIGILVGLVVAVVIYGGFKYRDIRDEEGERVPFLRRGIVGRQHEAKKRNIAKLKEHLKDKEIITNDEVESLLRVSHTTAWRYLDSLKKEGIIEQVGNKGRHVRYRIKKV